jgi:predicted nucleic acid-binding protein
LTRFVLDASVALGWIANDPPSPYAVRVMNRLLDGDRAFIPALWHLEVANWFVVALRRKMVDAADSDRYLSALDDVIAAAIDTETTPAQIRKTLETARSFQLSAYDARYLELSLREGLPLATLDKALRKAATRAGVKLLQ